MEQCILGAPYWDPGARGQISGITRGTGRPHLARSALEAICYQSTDIIQAMQKDSGLIVRNLKVDGGAAANDFLCGFQADIARVNVIRPSVIETTSLGSAYLAGIAAGYWKNSNEIKKCWQPDRKFRPLMDSKKADKFYQGWKKAVAKALTVKR